jgi:hypothetical protein
MVGTSSLSLSASVVGGGCEVGEVLACGAPAQCANVVGLGRPSLKTNVSVAIREPHPWVLWVRSRSSCSSVAQFSNLRLISHHFFRYLYFYCMLLWFNTGAISVRVHLSKLCAKEKDLRGVINPQKKSNQRAGRTIR